MGTRTRIDLGGPAVAADIARMIRQARLLTGWSQRELAVRAGISQATVSRMESGHAASLELLSVGRVCEALGLRACLDLDDWRLDDRRRQTDRVHAAVNARAARGLAAWGWHTALEVLIGDDAPLGWIDLLAYRPADRALLVQETKTDIPDAGALQRSVTFYERRALEAAGRLGWHPARVAVLVVVLDSQAVADRLAANRALMRLAFPAPLAATRSWLLDPGAPAPRGWAIGACDPRARGAAWLRPTILASRRSAPAYRDYAEAAGHLPRR